MRKLAFLLVMIGMTVPAFAATYDVFTWTGDALDGNYMTSGNWNPAGPPVWDPVTKHRLTVLVNNGDTVTVDSPGATAGQGWNAWLYLGDATGDGHILLNAGGEITGAVRIGTGGATGTVVQSGGNWLCEGGARIGSAKSIEIGRSATGYGSYDLQAGSLGQDGTDDPMEFGTGYLHIGPNGPGDLIQAAGTRIQTRSDYRAVISGGNYGAGVYTMNGGTLRAHAMFLGEYGTAVSATWNINSTDVDIVFGGNAAALDGRLIDDPSIERPAGIQLGREPTGGLPSASAVRPYWGAVEGLPGQTGLAGQTVTIGIVAGRFQNYMYGAEGRDADVAGLNNITLAFSDDPANYPYGYPVPVGYATSIIEVAGKDMGPSVAGLTNNFALEGLIVGGAAGGTDATQLLLQDLTDNMADDVYDEITGDRISVTPEVLYTEALTVNAGSLLLLDGKTLYYYRSQIDGFVLPGSGGALVQIDWIPGDANLDVAVGIGDLAILGTYYGTTTGMTWQQADFNGDGAVDIGDLALLGNNYGTGTGVEAGVPEPATLTLLGLGALALIRRRRRQ